MAAGGDAPCRRPFLLPSPRAVPGILYNTACIQAVQGNYDEALKILE